MRVELGPVAEIAEDRCQAVGDGSAVVFRVGDDIRVFSSRCLHQDSSLDGGWIRDGVLSCPLHFWRYDIADGGHIGTSAPVGLEQYPVTIVDGHGFVELPEPEPPRSFREQQLAHAAEWNARRAGDRQECENE